MTKINKEQLLTEAANNASNFTPGENLVYQTVIKNVANGCFWGFAKPSEVKEVKNDLDVMQQAGQILYHQVYKPNSEKYLYLIQVTSLDVVLNLMSSIVPSMYSILVEKSEIIYKKRQEDIEKCQKYLEKAFVKGKAIAKPIAIYSPNESNNTTIIENGAKVRIPSFSITKEDLDLICNNLGIGVNANGPSLRFFNIENPQVQVVPSNFTQVGVLTINANGLYAYPIFN